MENKFNGESFSLGWLDCYFLTNKTFTESQAKRYLELLETLKQKGDDKTLLYIGSNYPNLAF